MEEKPKLTTMQVYEKVARRELTPLEGAEILYANDPWNHGWRKWLRYLWWFLFG